MKERSFGFKLVVATCIGALISGLTLPVPRSSSDGFWSTPLIASAYARPCTVDYQTNCSLPEISIGASMGPSKIIRSGDDGGSWGYISSGGGGYYRGGSGAGYIGSYLGRSTTNNASNAETGNPKDNCAGDPINIATGNQYESETDYATFGSFPIALSRYYNSIDSDQLNSFGKHWRASYSRSISLKNTGGGWQMTVTRDDGQVLLFKNANPNYYWETWTGPSYSTLRATTYYVAGYWWSGVQLTTDQDETELYSLAGKLLSITNRAGKTQSFGYDGLGRLVSIVDPYGRTLTLSYIGLTSVISQVRAPDGGVYNYGYDGLYRLVSVSFPGASRRQYIYGEAAFPYAITGLIDENGVRYASWDFDSAGRATLAQHNLGADRTTVD